MKIGQSIIITADDYQVKLVKKMQKEFFKKLYTIYFTKRTLEEWAKRDEASMLPPERARYIKAKHNLTLSLSDLEKFKRSMEIRNVPIPSNEDIKKREKGWNEGVYK